MAGYNVNIGLAIASGAAAGGILGGAGATQWGQLGAFAAATAAFALGVNYAYEAYQQYGLTQAEAAEVKASEDLVVAKNSGSRPSRDLNPRKSGVPESANDALGESFKEIYDMQQDMAGRIGNTAESNVNFRRDMDRLSLPPGSQKGQYYYTDPRGNIVGGPTDRPALHEGLREHYRILRNPGAPQLRQGR